MSLLFSKTWISMSEFLTLSIKPMAAAPNPIIAIFINLE
jgi:hypothetical protein